VATPRTPYLGRSKTCGLSLNRSHLGNRQMSNKTGQVFVKKSVAAYPICPIWARFMRKLLILTLTVSACAAFCPRPAFALVFSAPKPNFRLHRRFRKKQSVEVVDKYYPKKIVHPFAKSDTNIDPKLRRAATIAQERARAHSLSKCWRFCEGGACCRRRGQIPAANNPGETGRPGVGEELRLQEAAGLGSI